MESGSGPDTMGVPAPSVGKEVNAEYYDPILLCKSFSVLHAVKRDIGGMHSTQSTTDLDAYYEYNPSDYDWHRPTDSGILATSLSREQHTSWMLLCSTSPGPLEIGATKGALSWPSTSSASASVNQRTITNGDFPSDSVSSSS